MSGNRLLLYLHAEDASWLMLDAEGQIQQSISHAPLSELVAPLDYEVQVIVPATDILLTFADLPKLNSQRIRQALPFALEEQLIDDVSNLHFAIGEHQLNQGYPVAIVSQTKMESWLERLSQASITPSALIPASLTLPFTSDNWYACLYAAIGFVRTGEYSGFACDQDNLAIFLAQKLTDTIEKPSCVHLYNFSGSPTRLEVQETTFNEMALPENQFLEHIVKWLETYPYINLLQGNYRVTQKAAPTKKIWVLAGYVASVWIALAFINNLGSYFILHHATAATEEKINTIYKRNFPQATSVVAPRQRMEEKLKKFSTEANKNDFLSLLGFIGKTFSANKGIQLQNLEFHGSQLTLNVSAPAFDQLDAFTKALSHPGLTVKQQNASIQGTSVKASILISQGAV
jgi:general secretion pathway protein L